MSIYPVNRFSQLSHVFPVGDYGTVVNGGNITAAWRNALAKAAPYGKKAVVYLPAGTYYLDTLSSTANATTKGLATLPIGVELLGDGPTSTIIRPSISSLASLPVNTQSSRVIFLSSGNRITQIGFDGYKSGISRSLYRRFNMNLLHAVDHSNDIYIAWCHFINTYCHPGITGISESDTNHPDYVDRYKDDLEGFACALDGAANVLVEDCQFLDNDNTGIHASAKYDVDGRITNNVTFQRLYSARNGWMGYATHGAGKNIVLDNCVAEFNIRKGLVAEWVTELTATNCRFSDNGLGTTLTYTNTNPALQAVIAKGPNVTILGEGRDITFDTCTFERAGSGHEITAYGGNFQSRVDVNNNSLLYSEPISVTVRNPTVTLNSAIADRQLIVYNQWGTPSSFLTNTHSESRLSHPAEIVLDAPNPELQRNFLKGGFTTTGRQPNNMSFPQFTGETLLATINPVGSPQTVTSDSTTDWYLSSPLLTATSPVAGAMGPSSVSIVYPESGVSGIQRLSITLPNNTWPSSSAQDRVYLARVQYRYHQVKTFSLGFHFGLTPRGDILVAPRTGGEDVGEWQYAEIWSRFVSGDTPSFRFLLSEPGVYDIGRVEIYQKLL